MTLTIELIRAAAMDAGNRSMRKGNRVAWGEADYDAASETYIKLLAELERANG